ncbi:hypothetical protein MTO96_001924 [Rhipicephalus appendiculatus]
MGSGGLLPPKAEPPSSQASNEATRSSKKRSSRTSPIVGQCTRAPALTVYAALSSSSSLGSRELEEATSTAIRPIYSDAFGNDSSISRHPARFRTCCMQLPRSSRLSGVSRGASSLCFENTAR